MKQGLLSFSVNELRKIPKSMLFLCGSQVVKSRENWNIVMLLLNFLLPGSGTIMNGLCFHEEKS